MQHCTINNLNNNQVDISITVYYKRNIAEENFL